MPILINELLPNPKGKDADGEFIELFNNSVNRVSLANYTLADKGGKKYLVHSELGAGEYLVLPYSLTKLNLNNTGDAVFLYDSRGQLIDRAEFLLQAKEGASFARNSEGVFSFTDTPTPGVANQFREVFIQKENLMFQQAGAVISNSLSGFEVIAAMLIISVSLAAVSVYILKNAIHPPEYIL